MIKDPIRLNNHLGWYEVVNSHAQKLMFYISSNEKTLSLSFVINANYPFSNIKKIFSVCPSDKNSFTIGTRLVEREEFLEYLSREYPEHLEWLLFHQEWLK
jgi:hypothetical protein